MPCDWDSINGVQQTSCANSPVSSNRVPVGTVYAAPSGFQRPDFLWPVLRVRHIQTERLWSNVNVLQEPTLLLPSSPSQYLWQMCAN